MHSSHDEQLAFAASQQRTLVTHNRADFELLHQSYVAAGTYHSGIIIAVRHPPHEIMRRLALILDRVAADEMHGQLRFI